MATFKLNLATVDNCPDPKTLVDALEEYGCPEDHAFGVLNAVAGEQVIQATLIKRSFQALKKLDAESGEVLTDAVEKVAVIPLALFPAKCRMELYEGSASAIDQVGGFLSSDLALPTVVNTIDLDILSAVKKLQSTTNRFQLKSLRVSEYAHNSYMLGPYAPKFLDTNAGLDFMEEYVDFVTSASVAFQGPSGRVTVTLTPKACLRYSLGNEDDRPQIQALLRTLL